ncbi:hypothetical protein L593_04735 [Salinarchaeum sp. Harcht-Bsk1]|uniref:hypothetical protein n=1 Tax=Salinarchaeum sp. Harcht-Bsk1 TaxID=1333523 RepID=UPI0003422F0F|nr:hypothetical protein [Salinarchaeum sp. Harcht-Bsk1]AGN00896.1 hypothetical protein L593_04735 [Salinarchaeum sp. Harcht-Bsk1]
MQGRAAAVYGLVFLLVAAGAYGFVTVAEAPEPSMDNPDVTFAETGENQTIGERTYRLDGFGSQRGQPTATLVWTDEDARSTESWTHAAEPGGTTVTTAENVTYWVRIPQDEATGSFTLLETPAEGSNVTVVTDSNGNWVVEEGTNYTALEEYDGFERVEVENGSTLAIGTGNDTRDVRVDQVTNESVTVSWNEPAETEITLRQTSVKELEGTNVTVHVPGDGSLEMATSEEPIDDYLEQHEDRTHFQERMDGLKMSAVLSLVSFVLLVGMAFLPRKE